MKNIKDLIIIGGSAAGVAAAIYAARRALNFVILTGDIGGEVLLSGEIENYPAIVHTDGVEMTKRYTEQLDYYNVERELETFVEHIEKDGSLVRVHATYRGEKKEYYGKAVIIATGVKPRHLEIKGEKELYQKGVTYCTVCDGPLFKKKITATIGTGNSALESALMMADIATQHYVLIKYKEFRGDTILINKLKAKSNVIIIPEATTTEIIGDTKVQQLIYTNAHNESHTIDVQGIFVHIGMTPQSSFASLIEKTPSGNIIADRLCRTNIEGVFAAGDVTDIPYQQIVIASGQGATAALAAIEYINKWE